MEHEHEQDEEFIEVKFKYVEFFNRSLDDMTQIQRSAVMPGDTMTSRMSEEYGVKIVIYPNDHLPAHFHVYCRGHRPAFNIKTGERLKGHKGLEKVEKRIKKIWRIGRYEILDHWNNLRSDDCSHGRINPPASWPPRDSEELKDISYNREDALDWIKNVPRT